jgi:hypothetical protein
VRAHRPRHIFRGLGRLSRLLGRLCLGRFRSRSRGSRSPQSISWDGLLGGSFRSRSPACGRKGSRPRRAVPLFPPVWLGPRARRLGAGAGSSVRLRSSGARHARYLQSSPMATGHVHLRQLTPHLACAARRVAHVRHPCVEAPHTGLRLNALISGEAAMCCNLGHAL